MKKNSSNLNKKRNRAVSPYTITVGKSLDGKYFYITDSISGKSNNTKIKISMVDIKEEKTAQKEHEEEKDDTLDVLNMGSQILKEELPKIVDTIQNNENEIIYIAGLIWIISMK